MYKVVKAPGRMAPDVTFPVLSNGAPFSRVSQFKCLGHCLADNLKDDVDVKRRWL